MISNRPRSHDSRAGRTRARTPTVLLASQNRSNDVYTQLLKDDVAKIGQLLKPPIPFNLTIEARVGAPVTATAWAETSVLSASGGYTGSPGKCVVVVTSSGDALSAVDVRLAMAHEAWHCYQGQILGLQRTWYDPPAPWITEGQAEWVGDSLEPDAPVAQGAWPGYLPEPDVPLFKRAYAAVGFYAQLDSSGTDPWTSSSRCSTRRTATAPSSPPGPTQMRSSTAGPRAFCAHLRVATRGTSRVPPSPTTAPILCRSA